MSLQSMTGFGEARFDVGPQSYRIEVRTVNHRHLDLKSRLPTELAQLEGPARELIARRVGRGHVSLAVMSATGASATDVFVDRVLARRAYESLSALRDELGCDAPVTLDHVLHVPGVLQSAPPEIDAAAARAAFEVGLDRALTEVARCREAEGARLATDLLSRAGQIERFLEAVEAALPAALAAHRARLRSRLDDLLEGRESQWGDDKLAAEMALLVDRSDVSEELTRIRAHLAALREMIAEPGDAPKGRRLEFLSVELHRELNTLGAKSASVEISHITVDARAENERIREQVANVL
jgi:uncharacterized protein (TIGR00255 family)